jgi:pyruvate,water dikinase
MYLGLREASKHYLMLGFERIRAHLREIGRRLGLGDDIFFLALDDLPTELRAVAIERLRAKASANERERKLLLTLNVPPVIFSDELDVIGGPLEIASADEWQATALSFGSFEGPALVLEEPIPAEEVAPGFVLVCPSTDPAWVPLFIKAGALVMESGGVLSHGAIVARELNIPAVAGVPNVHRRLRTGQRLAVDGTAGRVHVLADANP